ncbi:hypothetical protein SDC9_87946 [bioreactor metagenome]|uniref:Uncharacterized protein n=1 Tax=bioreactor metagenome TaxID=1076179 RepID=A0A644ZK88_9ZZZZ
MQGVRGGAVVLGADDAVDEVEQEPQPGGIGDQPGEQRSRHLPETGLTVLTVLTMRVMAAVLALVRGAPPALGGRHGALGRDGQIPTPPVGSRRLRAHRSLPVRRGPAGSHRRPAPGRGG